MAFGQLGPRFRGGRPGSAGCDSTNRGRGQISAHQVDSPSRGSGSVVLDGEIVVLVEGDLAKAGWKEGEITPPSIAPLKIDRAKIVAMSDVVDLTLRGEEVDDTLLFIEHPTRPFLCWVVQPKK